MISDKPKDLITLTAARKILGVSQAKMAAIIRKQTLTHYQDALDARVKLVSRADVLGLISREKAA